MPAARGRPVAVVLAAVATTALFALTRPYRGIVHDAIIYVGRALADARPGFLGDDILFAHDGQSAFSLYPRALVAVVALLGPSAASALAAGLGLAAWFAAAAVLAGRLASGRLLVASLAFVAIMPPAYGGFAIIRYGEQFATPRGLAEAGVMAALAALLAGRDRLALAVLAGAALLHPIMTAPGLAIWLAVRGAGDRRVLAAAAAGALGFGLAGRLGLPVAERLFTIVDPDWASAVSTNAYLFPSRWAGDSWGRLAPQAVTLGVAAFLAGPGRARILLVATLAVAAGGLLLAGLAADRWLVLLVLQVQPWRCLWVAAVLAHATLPLVAVSLWRRGPAGRAALAALAFAWLSVPTPPTAFGGALLCAAILAVESRAGLRIGGRIAALCCIAVALFGLLVWGPRAVFAYELWRAKPDGASFLAELWGFWVFTVPLGVAAVAWAGNERWRVPLGLQAVVAGGLAVAAIALWDDRPASARRFDGQVPDPALVRLLPDEPGEILWLRNGGYEAWSRAGRRNWVSFLQGASMIFSRDLALLWRDRADRLVAAHLMDGADRLPMGGERALLRPTPADIASICGAPDGPVALVVPQDGGIVLPDGLAAAFYGGVPDFSAGETDGHASWNRTDTHAVVACRSVPGAERLRSTLQGEPAPARLASGAP